MTMATEFQEKLETIDDLRKEVSRINSMVTEAVTDGVRSALRAMETGREAAEDAIRDAERMTKRNPKQALGIAFVAGAALCGLTIWIAARER